MIKWIHNNKRSLSVILIMSVVVLSMSFFGVDMAGTRERTHAIKINDQVIEHSAFNRERRQLQETAEQRYRQILGENYNKLAPSIPPVGGQQVVDKIVADTLIQNAARELGMFVGPNEIRTVISHDLFGDNYDPRIYEAYLSQIGLTSLQFENRLRNELLRSQYQRLISDALRPSEREARALIIREKSTYDVRSAAFTPDDFISQIAVPADADLESYYIEHSTDFEQPAAVAYDYVVFDAASFEKLVEISPEDVEIYYADNESRFMEPEEARVRQIQLSIPKDASEEKRAEIKQRAEEAQSKAQAGENFDTLVKLYSDDVLSAAIGGSLGWIKPGKMSKQFDKAVFGLKGAGIAPLVSGDSAFQIVKVEEYKAAAAKPLASVRGEIESELRTREAPSYAAAAAQETFAKWSKDDALTLADVARTHGLGLQTSGGPLTAERDPQAELKTLTAQILRGGPLPKQTFEIGDRTVLVKITELKEARIPPFADARDDVIGRYKGEQAAKVARDKAHEALTALDKGDLKNLKDVAEKYRVKLTENKALNGSGSLTVPFNDRAVQSEIFSVYAAPSKPRRVHNVNGRHYLFEVTALTPPAENVVKEVGKQFVSNAEENNQELIARSLIIRLKSRSQIDIDPSILVNTASSEES